MRWTIIEFHYVCMLMFFFSCLSTLRICIVLLLMWESQVNTLQSISTIQNVAIIIDSFCKYWIDELSPDNDAAQTKKETKWWNCTHASTVLKIIVFKIFGLRLPNNLIDVHCSLLLASNNSNNQLMIRVENLILCSWNEWLARSKFEEI